MTDQREPQDARDHDMGGENPHADSVRKLAGAMLRTGTRFGVVTAILAIAISTVLIGWAGLFGSLAGALVGFASSLVTVWMMHKTATLPAEAVLGVVLGGYTLKIVALLVVMLTLRPLTWFDPMALALTVLATVVAWTVAEVRAFQQTRIPTIISGAGRDR